MDEIWEDGEEWGILKLGRHSSDPTNINPPIQLSSSFLDPFELALAKLLVQIQVNPFRWSEAYPGH